MSPPLPGALGQRSSHFPFILTDCTTRRGGSTSWQLSMFGKKTRRDNPAETPAPPPRPRPGPVRAPPSPSHDSPALLLPRTRPGLVATDKASYRSWRSPSGRPAPRLSELTSTRAGGKLGGPGVPSWALPRAPSQLGPAYRLGHLAGQGRAPASPSPAPTFEVNKWKRLSPPPSVARLISTAHRSLRGTKGAQRRGQLRPGSGEGAGGGGPKRPVPSPPHPRPGRR